MALPKQVQAQADAVEQYEKQVAEAQAQEPTQTDSPPIQPAPFSDSPSEPAVDSSKPADPDSAAWRQRYLSLQGQYNSQVPALQQQVQQLSETLNHLTERLKAAEEATPQPAQESPELVTKIDVETFGADLVDLARRIAKDEFGKRESKYVKQIEALEGQLADATGKVGQVAQSQAQTVKDRFFEDLDRRVPGWDQVQATEECQTWLSTRIPGTSATWDQALKEAAAKRDVSAVEELFGAFYERHPTQDPRAKAKPNSNRQELQRQIAPGKSTAQAATPQSRRTYTGADYQAESMRLMRFMQKGQNDAATQLEAELNAALAEGRVVP